jgi:hypothetical protein
MVAMTKRFIRTRTDDFAQHHGAAGAGDAGEISRQAVQGAIS